MYAFLWFDQTFSEKKEEAISNVDGVLRFLEEVFEWIGSFQFCEFVYPPDVIKYFYTHMKNIFWCWEIVLLKLSEFQIFRNMPGIPMLKRQKERKGNLWLSVLI